MADKYRPTPSGPKSSRNYTSSYGSSSSPSGPQSKSYHKKDTYKPENRRRYNNNNNNNNNSNNNDRDRDNYRPDVYKPSQSQPQPPQSNAPASSESSVIRPSRPSGPSKYRENNRDYEKSSPSNDRGIGSKRPMVPSGPSNYKKKKPRDYTSSFVSKRPDGPKGFPTGPRDYTRPNGPGSRGPSVPIQAKNPKPRELPKLLPSQIYSVQVTRSTKVFDRVQQVGEGTYGKVYKAKNNITNEFVALKKLRLETEREGFPITSIREIKLLQSCDHENIVGLLEMMVESNQIYMVFDYLDHDLTGLLTHPDLKLQECHRKFIFKQLMEGLNYLHKKRIIHRDIKGSNILLDSTGNVKIADFGLARNMKILNDGESPDYTNRVITIWYRPPELLLGATNYGRKVDIWGVGCLLIELYSRIAAFQGYDEVSQLCKIFNIMGTPSFKDWPNIDNLPWFEMLKPKVNIASKFKQIYESQMSELSYDLAIKLLALDPAARLTAEQALKHDYFIKDPQPEPLYFLKEVKGEWHEFETKKRRRRERKRLQDEAKAKEMQENLSNKSKDKEESSQQSEINEDDKHVTIEEPDILKSDKPLDEYPKTEDSDLAGDRDYPKTIDSDYPRSEGYQSAYSQTKPNDNSSDNEITVDNNRDEVEEIEAEAQVTD